MKGTENPVSDWNMTFDIGNVENKGVYSQGVCEITFLHVLRYSSEEAEDFRFTLYLNENRQFQLEFHSYYDEWEDEPDVNISIFDGSSFDFIYHNDYYYNADEDFFFYPYHLVIDYTFNSIIRLNIYELTNLTSNLLIYSNNSLPCYIDDVYSNIHRAQLEINSDSIYGSFSVITAIDSSREHNDYQKMQLLDIITKNVTAYNSEGGFSFALPQRNWITMQNYSVTSIHVKSALSNEEFISFQIDFTGLILETFTGIDDYTELSSSVYNDNLEYIFVNVRYRCKNLNPFYNTIYLQFTFIYDPVEPTFITMILLALPTIFMLIIPSGAAYIKFKRSGFLMVFFVMTLILTSLSLIPLGIGLIMILILIIVFTKLIQNDREQGDTQ